MPQIIVYAKSGDGEPHQVVFASEEGKLTITCDCERGIKGHYCEHKVRLAVNDHLLLSNPAQIRDLNEAHIWVIQAPVSDLILSLLQLEGDPEGNEEAIRRTQLEIAAAMREGT
ncbi:MAG: hypothetical protein JSV26_10620 [bacterium]|nr:MAG: hypothetical protein JSV26_10620 [bacterium]